jgi:hypothetical protein
MAKVDIRRSRVKSCLHAKRLAAGDRTLQSFQEFVLYEDFDCAPLENGKLFLC